jgi:acetoin utilization protein AcuB
MIVSMWMSRNLLTVSPEMSVADAAAECARRRVRRLLVTERGLPSERLLGLVSLTDISRAFPPEVNPLSALAATAGPKLPVGSIMARDLRTVTLDTPIEEAARVLRDHKIGALPVMNGEALAGIITESDIFRSLVEILAPPGDDVRVTFDLHAEEDPIGMLVSMARLHKVNLSSVVTMVHEDRKLGSVRITGEGAKAFVDGLWASSHRVLSVVGPASST